MRDDVCRDIARWGEPYNPYKPPHSPAQKQQDSPVAEATQPKPQVPQQSGAVSSSVQRATRSLARSPNRLLPDDNVHPTHHQGSVMSSSARELT